jgi:hypothetical protein
VPTSRRGYPGRRPILRGRESLPFQRTYVSEHQGLVVVAVIMLVFVALLLFMIAR